MASFTHNRSLAEYVEWATFRRAGDVTSHAQAVTLTDEARNELDKAWLVFLEQLYEEVPEEKRATIFREALLQHRTWNDTKEKELLQLYNENKAAGEPYEMRAAIADRMKALDALKREDKEGEDRLRSVKKATLALQWLDPSWAAQIERMGFAEWLKRYWWYAMA